SPGRSAATLVFTGIIWRNSWKYRARTYRHLFWDAGTMLANSLAVAVALGLAPRLFTGFVDAMVHRLVGVDATDEVALALLTLGPETSVASTGAPPPAIDHATLPLSHHVLTEPVVTEAPAASALATPEDVIRWRGGRALTPPPPTAPLIVLPTPDTRDGRALGETIQRRGSTRHFGWLSIGLDDLGAALWAASRPVPAHLPTGLTDIYMSIHAVAGVDPGSYRYHREGHALEPLHAGDFRRQAAFLCLEQPLGGDAAVTLFFLSRLDARLAQFGERGYPLVDPLA